MCFFLLVFFIFYQEINIKFINLTETKKVLIIKNKIIILLEIQCKKNNSKNKYKFKYLLRIENIF